MTTVVNMKKDDWDYYIGRGSIFGNPYEIGRDGSREEVIAKYKKWFDFMIQDEIFLKELKTLKDKRLACFCKPYMCHGDVIADYINKNF